MMRSHSLRQLVDDKSVASCQQTCCKLIVISCYPQACCKCLNTTSCDKPDFNRLVTRRRNSQISGKFLASCVKPLKLINGVSDCVWELYFPYILLNGLTYNPAEYFTSFERIFPSPEMARKNARNE